MDAAQHPPKREFLLGPPGQAMSAFGGESAVNGSAEPRQQHAAPAMPGDSELFAGSGACHEQQAAFALYVLSMSRLILISGGDGTRRRHMVFAHPHHREAPELESLHTMHRPDGYGIVR